MGGQQLLGFQLDLEPPPPRQAHLDEGGMVRKDLKHAMISVEMCWKEHKTSETSELTLYGPECILRRQKVFTVLQNKNTPSVLSDRALILQHRR